MTGTNPTGTVSQQIHRRQENIMSNTEQKYVIEYHLDKGSAVARLCDNEEHMNKLVTGFAGSRKGVHDFVMPDEESGREVRVVIPLEQVKAIRSYVADVLVAEAKG